MDRTLVHAVESVIIDWAHQIQTVLKRDSAQPLLEGLNPVPFVELEFWKARTANLECIFEQVFIKRNIVFTLFGNGWLDHYFFPFYWGKLCTIDVLFQFDGEIIPIFQTSYQKFQKVLTSMPFYLENYSHIAFNL